MALENFERKYNKNEIEKKNREREKWKKIKNRFKINKLFLYATSYLFKLF